MSDNNTVINQELCMLTPHERAKFIEMLSTPLIVRYIGFLTKTENRSNEEIIEDLADFRRETFDALSEGEGERAGLSIQL